VSSNLTTPRTYPFNESNSDMEKQYRKEYSPFLRMTFIVLGNNTTTTFAIDVLVRLNSERKKNLAMLHFILKINSLFDDSICSRPLTYINYFFPM